TILTKEHINNPSKIINIETLARPLPYKNDTVVEIPITQPGVYYVWGTFDGQSEIDRNNDPITVICSDIAPTILSFNGKAYPYALNASTGQPIKGVSVSINYQNSKTKSTIDLGVTDTDGTLERKDVESNGTMLFSRDNQIVSCTTPYSYESDENADFYQSASIYTSLPIYHHGDSVQWSIVVFSSRRDEHRLDTNTEVCVKLFDANYSLIDSVNVTTDNSGRACGCFKLPDEGLSGNYKITVNDDEDDDLDGIYFKVNDYKLPTFTATISSFKRGLNPDSIFTVTCEAKTYSGFPVADARVSVELADAELYSWDFAHNDKPFWTTDTVTDSNGRISITIPQAIFDLSPSESDGFNISFDITSPSGETRS
ncbi:MAG: hypothetical protein K2K94_02355, partial [Muribaculaceae bacterium]|nr:hypothetical protein [Muribaculaceae bacterium]